MSDMSPGSADPDRLIHDYLRRLRRAARALPRRARQELLAEVMAHIAEARGAGETAGQVGAGDLLRRLGDPDRIVAAAREGADAARPGAGRLQVAAVFLLLAGGALGLVLGVFGALAGWIAGAVLLWASPRWRWGDKLVGTLIWPGGLAAPILLLLLPVRTTVTACSTFAGHTSCQATGSAAMPVWAAATLEAILLAAPFVVAIWLLDRARKAALAAG